MMFRLLQSNNTIILFCNLYVITSRQWNICLFIFISNQLIVPEAAILCNFIEITLRHGCSPVNLLHIFRTPFTKNTSERLLLLFLACSHFLAQPEHPFSHKVCSYKTEFVLKICYDHIDGSKVIVILYFVILSQKIAELKFFISNQVAKR